jgi:hypothetical protein
MPMPIFPGDGNGGFLPSYLSTLMFFGLELNSFILLFPSFGLCNCSGSGVDAGLGEPCDGCVPATPGECSGLLGNAAFAALVASILLTPMVPFVYVMPFVLNVTGPGIGGGLVGWPRPVWPLSPGAGIVVERFLLCWLFWCAYAACAAIWLVLRWLCAFIVSAPALNDARLGSK